MEYTADSSNKYVVNTRSYDRSDRLSGEEVFCLEPERSSDPLEDYFRSALGFMMGGISSELDPGRQPLVMDLELNEWKDAPLFWWRIATCDVCSAKPPNSDGCPAAYQQEHPL